MNKKINYQKKLDDLLAGISAEGRRPTLLLHACCGPCSSYVLEYLSSRFEITVLYYNPNIYPPAEYDRRLNELLTFYTKFVPAQNVKVIQAPYEPEDFYKAVGTRENPELAKISPFKDADMINEIGEALRQTQGPRWLPSDFKKKNGFKRSLELSAEYNLYRQEYCGCIYSIQPQTNQSACQSLQ